MLSFSPRDVLGEIWDLCKLPVPGRATTWMIVGQGSSALAVIAGGVVWTFLLSSIISLLFLPPSLGDGPI